MIEPLNPEVAILNGALELPAGQRAAYMDQACAGDAALRQQIEALLRAHEQAERFMEAPPTGLDFKRTVVVNVPLTEKPGDRIGRYKLLQQIGEGGCGVVYMAEQEEPVRRRVALKVIKLGMDTKQVIARFEAERQALALMDHPNIAKIFDAGITDAPLPASGHPLPSSGEGRGQGEESQPPATRHSPLTTHYGRPYFVMELVRGIKITDFCDEHNLSTTNRLKLFIQVCQAIQHAHQKGVIHRDIKPSNILVTVNDPAGAGCPKVIDFGIAKATQGRLTDQTLFTAFEQFIGTPAYMSPEQAVMTSLDIDTRSDIYSLGVLLYELLTGQTPFDAKDLLASGLDAMRRTIRDKEPLKPSQVVERESELRVERAGGRAMGGLALNSQLKSLSTDLDWIVMKSLEKDRARRYETANGLAMDIERHLHDEPVIARPPSTLYRLQKSVRRNRGAFAAATVIAAVLVIGVVISSLEAVRATRAERDQSRLRTAAVDARNNEAKLRAEAVAASKSSEQNAYSADIAMAYVLNAEGEPGRARDVLARYSDEAYRWLRGFEWGHLWLATASSNAASRATEVIRMPHPWCLRFDGLAVERFVQDHGVDRFQVLEIATSNVLSEVTVPSDKVFGWDISRDGRWVAVVIQFRKLELWELTTGVKLAEAPVKVPKRPHFSTDSRRIFIRSSDSVEIWELPQLRLVSALTNVNKVTHLIKDVLVGRSDDLLAATLYSAADGRPLAKLVGHTERVISLDASWDGRYLATPSADGTVRVWELPGGELRYTLMAKSAGNNIVQFSPNGRTLATAGADGTITLWNLSTGRRFVTLRATGSPLGELLFAGNGRTLAAYGRDGKLTIWRAAEY